VALRQLREFGIIQSLPHITEENIGDRSKGDWAIKTLALFQIAWLVAQLITRLANSLPTSALEVIALALAVLAMFGYGLQWSKPQDVFVAEVVPAGREPTVAEFQALLKLMPGHSDSSHQQTPYLSGYALQRGPGISVQAFLLCLALVSMVFGGIHLIAWSFPFPSTVETWLWRGCSLILCGLLSSLFLLFYFWRLLPVMAHTRGFLMGASYFCLVVYTASRLVILTIGFRSLYYLPSRAYVSTGISEVLHIG
jgi:hypothetical protein